MTADFSTLSKEKLAALVIHYQTLDDARLVTNGVLIEKLSAHEGDPAEVINQWSGVHNELTEGSKKEISRIVGGVPPGMKGN